MNRLLAMNCLLSQPLGSVEERTEQVPKEQASRCRMEIYKSGCREYMEVRVIEQRIQLFRCRVLYGREATYTANSAARLVTRTRQVHLVFNDSSVRTFKIAQIAKWLDRSDR